MCDGVSGDPVPVWRMGESPNLRVTVSGCGQMWGIQLCVVGVVWGYYKHEVNIIIDWSNLIMLRVS